VTKAAHVYTSRTAPIECPVCRRVLDAATGVALEPGAVAEPAAGDITCCAYCGAVLVFEAAGFRLAATEDLAAVDPDLRRLVLEFSASRTRNQPH
jgi:ribosomal protein S27E